MKTNPIKATHVYFEEQTETLSVKKSENEWYPINFQRIPAMKLNNELIFKTNKMKNLIMLPILVLFACLTSCSNDDDTLFGSGNLITETRNVDFFEKISSEGVFEVTVTQGAMQSVEVTADHNILSEVRTSVVNNELRLYLDNDHNYNGITLRATISATSLKGLENSGVGDMFVHNVDENGTFSIDNTGTADITIQGSASSLNIRNEGSGDIFGFDLFVNNCSIDIQGSGSVETSCSESLNADIEGSGNVYYKGNPSIHTTITGSGSVINAN